MVRRLLIVGFLGITAFGGIGCRLCDRDRRPLFDWYKDPVPQRRSGDGFLREPRSASDPFIPPTGLPPTGGSGGGDLPPPFVPESRSNRADPLDPRRELLLPQVAPGASRSRESGGLLDSPQAAGESRESKKVAGASDLYGFTRVKADLATGRVPTANGLDRLKKAGFKTVAYLHAPTADVTSVRKDVEGKGLEFVAVPVAPDRLSAALTSFNDTVANKTSRPIYVCDDDGVRTGSMWYLHFRTVEYANDDTARLLAAPLGLTEPPSAEQTTFWVAMRSYLATR